MTSKCAASLAAFLYMPLLCGSLLAHHGNVAYDTSKVVVFKDATVTKVLWANPHTVIMFDIRDDKGNEVHWAAEAGSPSGLGLLGWHKTSVQTGDIITVYLYKAKTGNPVGRLNKIVLADGTELKDSALGYRDVEQ